jgi:carboxylesterase type B
MAEVRILCIRLLQYEKLTCSGYTMGDSQGNPGFPLLQHSRNSIIYVSIQYRLGAYGFLYSPDLGTEGSVNLGLQDQRHALLWVKQHISSFGGDPDKVTIVGGSAGGGSVTSQLILYGGADEKLFRAAIAEYPWWQPYLTTEQLDTQYQHLLSAAQCNDTACLRGLSEDALATAAQATYINAYAAGEYGYGSFYFGPYVDGLVIQDLPSREFEKGNYVQVPLLVDRETFEGQTFSNRTEMGEEEEVRDLETLLPYADEGFVETVFGMYPRERFNSSYNRRVSWFG